TAADRSNGHLRAAQPRRSPVRIHGPGASRAGAVRFSPMTIEALPVAGPFPPRLRASGTSRAAFQPILPAADLPAGSMRRVSRGDLDVLLVHAPIGVLALDDRCPHMAAPLSIGTLEGCIVGCPLHNGRFDLASGDVVQMPTTG